MSFFRGSRTITISQALVAIRLGFLVVGMAFVAWELSEIVILGKRLGIDQVAELATVGLLGPGVVWLVTKRAERLATTLSESEQRYRMLAENASDIITRFRLSPRFHYEYVSPAVSRILGYSPEECYADPEIHRKLIHPDDMDRVLSQRARWAKGHLSDKPSVGRFLHKDGRTVWVESTTVAEYDDSGSIVAIETVGRDVTERVHAEQALREMALFPELNPAPLLRFGSDGLILSANPGALEVLGERAKPGLPLKTAIPAFEGVDLQACIRQGSSLVREAEIDGKFYQFVIRGCPDHRFGHAYGSDITQRKAEEKQRRESERQFRLLADNARDIIYRFRFAPKPGYEYVSPAAKSILGYDPEDFYRDPDFFLKVVHPEDLDSGRRRRKELSQGIGSSTVTTSRFVRSDGQTIWMEHTSALVTDEAGKVVAIETIGRDITQRIQAEEALRDSEERWRSVAEGSPDLIVTLDPEGTILTANRDSRHGSGMPIGGNIYDYIFPKNTDEMKRKLEYTIIPGTSSEIVADTSMSDSRAFTTKMLMAAIT